jgi:hypothetical protein
MVRKEKKYKEIIKKSGNTENLGDSIYRFQMGSANIKTLNIIKINKKDKALVYIKMRLACLL